MQDVTEMIDRYVELRDLKSDIEARLKEIKETQEELETLLIERMNELDLKAIKSTSGIMVSTVVSSAISVNDKVALYSWLRENNLEDMFTVNTKTLGAFVNSRIKSNEELPPGVEQFTQVKLSLRRG